MQVKFRLFKNKNRIAACYKAGNKNGKYLTHAHTNMCQITCLRRVGAH